MAELNYKNKYYLLNALLITDTILVRVKSVEGLSRTIFSGHQKIT